MRPWALLIILAIAGCATGGNDGSDAGPDGGSDAGDVSQLLGTWVGTATVVDNGQSVTNSAQTVISTTATGQLHISSLCPDGTNGGTADATSPTTFSLVPFACPASAVSNCASAVLTFASGTGNVSSGRLTFNASGSLSGCGSTVPVSVSFTGTH